MNNLTTLQQSASEQWQAFVDNSKPIVFIGMGTCGIAAGADKVLKKVQSLIETKKLDVQIVKVGCIGPCYLEPLLDVKMPGKVRLCFNNVDEDKVERIFEQYVFADDPKMKPIGHLGKRDEVLDGVKSFWEMPMLKNQTRIVLKNCGLIDPENISHYVANGGFIGLQKALSGTPEDVIEEVKKSGLRGRGGAGFPTHMKWKFCRDAKGSPKYLICNADEGDPGAFMNRSLMEGDPFSLIEGMIIAAYAIGANHG